MDSTSHNQKNLVSQWNERINAHNELQKKNPFSSNFQADVTRKGVANMCLNGKPSGYGRPPEGSKTEARGIEAHNHVSNEILELLDVILLIGQRSSDGKTVSVRFGDLFEFYVRISNKLVGMLLRARRKGLLDFPGEMLFQRRDDDVCITMPAQIPPIK